MSKKETAILVRLSEKEKKTLQRKARKCGMSVSSFVRTALIHSGDVSISVIDTEPLKKAMHELAKQGTNLNQFMKFLNTYGRRAFDEKEAEAVLAKEVETFEQVACALIALRHEAEKNNIHLRTGDFENPDDEE